MTCLGLVPVTVLGMRTSVALGLGGVGFAFFLGVGNGVAADFRLGLTREDAITCGYSDPSSIDAFDIEAVEGDRLLVHVTECYDGGGTCGGFASCGFDQRIELHDAEGFLKSAQSPLEYNSCRHHTRTSLGPERLFSSGRHTVNVTDINRVGEGGYGIFVQSTSNPARAEPLVSDTRVLASLDACGEVDSYTFEAVAGDVLSVEMNGGQAGNVVSRLEVYGPSGWLVAAHGGGRIDAEVLPSSGRFLLLAFSSINEKGPYELSLTVPEPESSSMWFAALCALAGLKSRRAPP